MNIWDFFGRTIGGLSDRYLGTNWLSSQAAEQAYNRQQDLQNANFQFQENMMNKQNEYNTPSNMMSRLRDAGLNPHLVNGQPVATSAAPSGGSSASAPMAQGANGAGDLIQSIQNASFMKKQKELLQAEIDNKNQDTFLKSGQYKESVANAALIEKQTETQAATIKEIEGRIELMRNQSNYYNESAKKIAFETDVVINDMALRNETFKDTVQMIKNQRTISDEQAKTIRRQINLQLQQMKSYIKFLDSQKNLNDEQKEYVQTIKENYENIKRITSKQADIIQNTGQTEKVIQMISQTMSSTGMLLGGAANLIGTIMSKGSTPNLYIDNGGNNIGDYNYNGVID